MQKQCKKCKKMLDLEEYHDKRDGKHGKHAECKPCIRMRSALYAAGHISEKRERDKVYGIKKREKIKKIQEMARQLNLDAVYQEGFEDYKKKCEDNIKRQCRLYLNTAVQNGYIIKPRNCEICSEEHHLIHGHHLDYGKPLDVIWACPLCHHKYH